MVLWIGVDDTDSLSGMCTTFLATEIVRDLTEDFDLIGYPRLVRLNPNIPWKTRGNGAICVAIGVGRGPSGIVGSFDGAPVQSFVRGETPKPLDEICDRVRKLVEGWAYFEDPDTNPAFVILRRKPEPGLYWKAVRRIVSLPEARAAVHANGIIRSYKNGRGTIGALSAVSWKPRDRTYEILTYRYPALWGTRRSIEADSVIEMDRAFPSTFDNYDYENSRLVIAPRTPCPILFGIRGDDPSDLRPAMEMVRGERPSRWLIFETNQGTDDHVVRSRGSEACRTVRFEGTVTDAPRTLPGGHVVFAVDGGSVTAYEPSKQFRLSVRRLLPGDRVEVIGAVRESPSTVNLEKIRVLGLVPEVRKVANPTCHVCFKRAKSLGRGRGFRCARCRIRFPESAAVTVRIRRALQLGWYEPPVGSRRHLSMPIKRMPSAVSTARRARLEVDSEATEWVPRVGAEDELGAAPLGSAEFQGPGFGSGTRGLE